jgi:putative flippase GtrA
MFLSRRFATFVVFGGLAALVNLIVGRTLYTVPHLAEVVPYWLAVGIGTSAGMVVNFALNYTLNFKYFERSVLAQFRTFVVVSIGGIVLTTAVAQGAKWLLRGLGLDSFSLGSFEIDAGLSAHVLAIGIVMFYSFSAHSAFSFNVGLRQRLASAWGRNLRQIRR